TDVTAGQQVQVNLDSFEFDTYLQLINADTGQVIGFDDDSGWGFNSQLTFTAEADIDYILRATSYGAQATGDYTLTTSVGSALPATPILDNQVITGTLDASDPDNPTRAGRFRDDYLLTDVFAGDQVQVSLEGGFDTYLQLVNADTGEIIDSDDDGGWGLDSQLTFTAAADVDYILRATSYGAQATGDYTLATSLGNVLPATPILDNQTITGTLDDSDPDNPTRAGRFRDDYRLTDVSAGDQVQVDLEADFDTYLQLINAATGEVIDFNDDGGWGLDSQLTFTAAADVDYLLRVTSFGFGVTGDYTLTTQTASEINDFSEIYGYGLVNAAAAVAQALSLPTFTDVPDLGGNQWGNDLVNAPEVWAQGFTGQGVTVAVIDSGVDIAHEDLVDNIWTNPGEIAGNGIDDDGNGFIDDINGWNFGNGGNNNVTPGTTNPSQDHGTHVAGTIAAMDNDLGITGVAYDADIMPIRMGDASGGYFVNTGSLADAIYYAVDNGADVINMSLWWTDSPELGDAMAYAAANGVITVSAAGNATASSPGNPASYATQFGISVGAVDSNRDIAYFSNRAGFDSDMQHVVAPGVDIFSTTPNDTYGFKNGTSMATPHVAGVVALMLSANPDLTHEQVQDIITDSAIALA
ncbi:MAG: S8 family peptidase, partial [Cyanobacteria bacterium P01_D01_bin.6]